MSATNLNSFTSAMTYTYIYRLRGRESEEVIRIMCVHALMMEMLREAERMVGIYQGCGCDVGCGWGIVKSLEKAIDSSWS